MKKLAVILILLAVGWAFLRADFIVMGDVRKVVTFERLEYSPQFERTVRVVNLLHPEVVVIVGDLIHGYRQDREGVIREWQAFLEVKNRIKAPVLLVPGNHEIFGERWAEELYVKYASPLYYSKKIGDKLFIVLNSEELGMEEKIGGAQLKFLKKTLHRYRKVKKKFVFLHKPLWEEEYKASGWFRDVHPLLVKYGVNAVFAGHFHSYRYMEKDGVHYFVTGGGGAEITWQEGIGDFYHFILVREKGKQLEYLPIKTDAFVPLKSITYDFYKKLYPLFYRAVPSVEPVEGKGETQSRVVLENPFPYRMRFILKYTSRRGWVRVVPERVELVLDPGEKVELPVKVKTSLASPRDLFPLPAASLVVRRASNSALFFSGSWNFKIKAPWTVKHALASPARKFTNRYSVVADLPRAFSENRPESVPQNQWVKVEADYDGYINLRKFLYPATGVYTYLKFRVSSPDERTALLVVDYGELMKVWFNGRLICTRGPELWGTSVCKYNPVKLRRGDNEVMVMVLQYSGAWRIRLMVADLKGGVNIAAE